MTVNTWRNEILNICKYCRHFTNNRKSRNRYWCWRFSCSVYDAHKCKVTPMPFVNKPQKQARKR